MSEQTALFTAVRNILRPLIRILLKNGIPYGALLDILKPLYVEVAAADIAGTDKKVTDSRIATVTGLSRKDVRHLKERAQNNDLWAFDRYNRAARVVTGWVRDARFLDKQGLPLTLPYKGGSPSFEELVTAFSGDIPTNTILDELQEAGVVSRKANGDVQLLKRVYIPTPVDSEKLGILGRDVAGLINTIDHNISRQDEPPFFQRKVFYDNLPDAYLPQLKELINREAQTLLEKIDHDMAARDRDLNPDVDPQGRNAAGISIYYFEETPPEE